MSASDATPDHDLGMPSPPLNVDGFPGNVPVLTDGVVTLRAPDPGDEERMVEMSTDAAYLRGTTTSRAYGVAEARERMAAAVTGWSQTPPGRRWTVEAQDRPGVLIGTVGLRPRAGGTVSLGYGLHPDARGRGLQSRAVRLACTHAFEQGIPRVHWAAFADNVASRRVAWTCGFTFHGVHPEDDVDGDGQPASTRYASLGAGDPMRPRTPWFTPAEVAGDGIRLRPWREEDGQHCEPLVDPAHYMPPNAAPTTETFTTWLEGRRERMAVGDGIYWCIADAGSDRPLGAVMLFALPGPMTGPSAEVGYFLFPAARGRGVTRTAVRLVVEHAFAPADAGGLGFARVGAVTAPDNGPSNAVLDAAGFTRWGLERAAWALADGGLGDGLHWERLRSGVG